MSFRSTKTYGHDLGLSCCFRQWRAKSHCSFFHGYAISVKLEFIADCLDATNWVMDFGGLKPVKKFLEDTFDHKTIVAVDDPELGALQALECMSLTVLPRVGCEAFAEHIGLWVQDWLTHQLWNYNVRRTPGGQEYRVNRVNLHHCEVREHGANSAIWFRD